MTAYANENPNPAPPTSAPAIQIAPLGDPLRGLPLRRATSAEMIRAARYERMLGILLAFVRDEAIAAGAPDAEEALIDSGLAIYEPYDPKRHGDLECDPEPGDLIWRLTEEALGLIQKAKNDRKRPEAI